MPLKSIGTQRRHDKPPHRCQPCEVNVTTPTRITCRANPRARGLIVISLALLAAGIWWIDGTLGALGLSGIMLVLLARWLGAVNLKNLSITIEAPQRATAGSAYPLRVTLTNRKRLLDANRITFRADLPGGADTAFETAWIAAGSAADFNGHARPKIRTDGREIPLSLGSDFPLGLFSFQTEASHPHAMLVFPGSRKPSESPGDGVMLDASPLAGATYGSAGGDIRGLRTWRSNDSPRRIAWPASMRAIARGAAPVVRETDPPGFFPQRCLIVIHSFASGGALIRPERFERAIELAGGWIERLRALGIRTRIAADFDAWISRPADTQEDIVRCRECLARASRRNSTEAHELQQALNRAIEDGETVILISDMPADSWQTHIPHSSPTPVVSKV